MLSRRGIRSYVKHLNNWNHIFIKGTVNRPVLSVEELEVPFLIAKGRASDYYWMVSADFVRIKYDKRKILPRQMICPCFLKHLTTLIGYPTCLFGVNWWNKCVISPLVAKISYFTLIKLIETRKLGSSNQDNGAGKNLWSKINCSGCARGG